MLPKLLKPKVTDLQIKLILIIINHIFINSLRYWKVYIMIPGMNKKQMKQMERQMKKMGMKMEDLEGVQEVIIRFEDKELIIDNPSVSLMNVMGQETYQIDGKAREVELEYEIEIPDEDVEMVANSAGVSEDEARNALEECKGDLAEAIMKLNQ